MSEIKKFIKEDSNNTRLDIFLSLKLNTNRSQIQYLIKNNLVNVNNTLAKKAGVILKNGDCIEIRKLEVDSNAKSIDSIESKNSISITRIYEDNDFLVLNKPPFLIVHPAPTTKEKTLVHWLRENNIRLSSISGELREGIVHRLDKETSGAMVVAKNNFFHSYLSTQLQNKNIGRIYIAIIDLELSKNLSIECFLSRHPNNRLKIAKITNNQKIGKYSKSSFYKLLSSNNGKEELILAKLHTGRTHQIRAHLESINRHIVGDSLYGYKGEKIRVMLHSYLLFLPHPKFGRMVFRAELFDDMRIYLANNFDMERVNEIITNIDIDFYN